MNREALDQQSYKSLEEKLVAKIDNSVSTMFITNIQEAFDFFKDELTSLSEKYPDIFLIEKGDNDQLLFSLRADEKRYEAYGSDRLLHIHFYKKGTDKRFEVKVGPFSNVYKFEPSGTGYGYQILGEGNEVDNFGLVGVPVNKLLVTTLLEKLSGPIDSLIFGAAK